MYVRLGRYLFLGLVWLLCLPLAVSREPLLNATQAERSSDDYANALERLESAIRYELEEKQLPAFSIALVDGKETVWAEGFGFEDEARQRPATADTIYRVGSISKLFTDLTVMRLVERGQLELDAPVHSYLPEFLPMESAPSTDVADAAASPRESAEGSDSLATRRPTLRQLMTHRSGLVREPPVGNYFDASEPSLEATVRSLNETALVYPPGSKTKYSNAAVAVLGAVLEQQLDQPFTSQVRASILEPLGMEQSSFELTPTVQAGMASGWMHTYDRRRFQAPEFLLGTGPAGNMYSSAHDLAKFLSWVFDQEATPDREIVSPETFRQMITPEQEADGKPQSFGIGFQVQQFDGYQKIGHGGAVYGFSTQLEALPERQLGVVAMSSLDGSNAVVERIAHYALRLLLAVQDQQPLPEYVKTTRLTKDRARELVGRYENSESGKWVEVEELDGRAWLRNGTFRSELKATADDATIVTDDVLAYGTAVEKHSSEIIEVSGIEYQRRADVPPADIPERWRGLIGEYGWDHNTLYILEDHGQLYALIEWFYYYPLEESDENHFRFPAYGLYHGEGLEFERDSSGQASGVVAAEVYFPRRHVGPASGETFRIQPLKPVDQLRATAMAAVPPQESGVFRNSEFVELPSLEPTLNLDIRYATTDNFMGSRFYEQPRAFLQAPAAEAVARAQQRLKHRDLGLLIHDAYRPWHVTKMFWDATPPHLKDFVANPASGSRHNRGCAVDLTLCEIESGQAIEMVAGYDEFSPRAFPLYPGGTSRQRWHRDLLRRVMEQEDFSVYEFEWWHFDYRDWQQYRIGNAAFEAIEVTKGERR